MIENLERKIVMEMNEWNLLRIQSFVLFLLEQLPERKRNSLINMELENSELINKACNSNNEELKELIFQAEYQ
tara:strand:+ start:43 stop:261 length:219 start_codon:yes stop_codon:yes gene_type:complete